MPDTPLLDKVHSPADLRGMTDAQLRQVADELRAETISTVSRKQAVTWAQGAWCGGIDRGATCPCSTRRATG